MRLTQSKLKKIIMQEAKNVLRESGHETEPSDKQHELHSLYSDMYKDRNNIRPRWVNPGDYSVEKWEQMIDELQQDKWMDDHDYGAPDFDEDEINYGSDEFGYDDHPDKRSEQFGSYRKNRDGDGY